MMPFLDVSCTEKEVRIQWRNKKIVVIKRPTCGHEFADIELVVAQAGVLRVCKECHRKAIVGGD